MEIIIPQPDKSLLLKELTPERFVKAQPTSEKNEITFLTPTIHQI